MKSPRKNNKKISTLSIGTLRTLTAALLAVGMLASAQNPANVTATAPTTQAPSPEGGGGNGGAAGPSLPVQVVPYREAVLSSEVSTPVEKLPFKLGDSFRAGEVLVILDCREIQAKHDYSLADAAELRARRESAVAEYMAAQETHVTKLRLQGLGAAGDLEVTLAAAAADKAKASVKQMEAC